MQFLSTATPSLLLMIQLPVEPFYLDAGWHTIQLVFPNALHFSVALASKMLSNKIFIYCAGPPVLATAS